MKHHWLEEYSVPKWARKSFVLSSEEALGSPYAAAMRLGFQELGLAGYYCVQGVPTVAFLNMDSVDDGLVYRIHKSLWNQSIASLFVVRTMREVLIYSLSVPPLEETHDQDERLIETLAVTRDALRISSFISEVESGFYFVKNKKKFAREGKVDERLLKNLVAADKKLQKEAGLTENASRSLLIQATFVSYLEDKEVIDTEYFDSIFGNEDIKSFKELLATCQTGPLYVLFEQLHEDFNGDVFYGPCSIGEENGEKILTNKQIYWLHKFREGLLDIETGQLSFWPYDFKYIPVELISSIYDQFLGEGAKKKKQGAYYTPRNLADFSVSQVWNLIEQIERKREGLLALDPACGSGIFLVRLFQRLVEDWRKDNKQSVPWTTLTDILKSIHGIDLNPTAVRLTVFSLYVALLEETFPPSLKKLKKDGKCFPNLLGVSVQERDFFAEEGLPEYDLIIGNPPWVSRKTENINSAKAALWCKKSCRPLPSGELAWAFVWKSLTHLTPKGHIGFLMPAMGAIHNHSKPTTEAKKLLLETARLKKVVDLSDTCFQLFETAQRPTVLLVIQNVADGKDYVIDYWAPKVTPIYSGTRVLSLDTVDYSPIKASLAKRDPKIWKKRLWGKSRDLKLLSWLESFPKMSEKIATYSDAKKKDFDSQKYEWIIGQGFKPAKEEKIGTKGYSTTDVEEITAIPFFDSKFFTPFILPNIDSSPHPTKTVHRQGFVKGFSGIKVVIPQGIIRNDGYLRAAYSEQSISFQHSLQAISIPNKDKQLAKFVTAYLNSSIATWFLFHTSANYGVDRAKVHEEQLLELPMVAHDFFLEDERRKKIYYEVVGFMNNLSQTNDQLMKPQRSVQSLRKHVDSWFYDFFDLSKDEILTIEDTVNYITLSVQPRAKGFPKTWEIASDNDVEEYAKVLASSLKERAIEGGEVVCKVYLSNESAAVRVTPVKKASAGSPIVCAETVGSLFEEIFELSKFNVTESLSVVPNIKIFLGDDLIIIKPRQIRYWLKGAALNDSDALYDSVADRHRISKR